METAVGVSNEFGFNLLNSCRETGLHGNLFFSSFSITTALLMLYSGTKGNTKKEIEDVFRLTQTGSSIHEEFHSLLTALKGLSGDATLNVANMLFVDKHFKILPEFSNDLQVYYNVESKKLDFQSNPDDSRQEINRLIELATNDKIKELFLPDHISAGTKLVLANAIYFKGKWSLQFNKDKTQMKPFYPNPGEEVQVSMMYNEGIYNYFHSQELKTSFLELPYLGDKLGMIIILPDMKNGLSDLEKETSLKGFNNAIKKMKRRIIHLTLPKFKIEEGLNLNKILLKIGIRDAFSSGANLSGISDDKNLFVSSVVHKAFVEVNEGGTEAAAATGILGFIRSAVQSSIDFVVDHPFMFVIRERTTGLILFTGSINKLP